MTLHSLLVPFLLLLGFSSCAMMRDSTNEPLSADAFLELQPGVTSAADTVALLGAPNDVVQLGKRSAYRYDATNRKTSALFLLVFNMRNVDQRSDRVWLFFDENERLTHKSATLGTHRTQYAAIWENIYEDSDAAEKNAERPSVDAAEGSR